MTTLDDIAARDALRDGPWQQLSDTATPGPWTVSAIRGRRDGYVKAGNRTVADVRYKNGDADAALIVAAVNLVRSLLTEGSDRT